MKLVFNNISMVVIILLLSIVAYGQYPPNTIYSTIVPPAGAVAPPYLSTYDDGSTMTRFLKITQEGGATHSYSKTQPWNIDGTKYKIRTIAVYDANTHSLYKSLGGLDMYESMWSNTDPNIIYGFTIEGKIRRYNIDTEVLDLLYDLNKNTEVYDEVKLGPGEGNIDIHDKYVALITHVKNTSDVRIIVFDLQTYQVVTTKTFEGMWRNADWQHQYIDWVSVSQSGDYLGIMWDHSYATDSNPFVDQNGASHYGVEIYNTINLNYLRRIIHYGNHGDFGFAPDGSEVFVQFYGNVSGGTVFSYHLDGSGQVDIIHTDNIFNTNGNHLSCRNILRPGWAYLNTDNLNNGHARMLAVKLDGSEIIENFGHSFESSNTYARYSFPVPNPTGTKIMFKSNFGDESSDNKICDYEAYPILSTPSKSLEFNKNSDDEYVVTEDNTSFVSGSNWTMEAWINFNNFDATGNENHIMRLDAQLFVDNNHKLKVQAGGNYVSGATVLLPNRWYHIAYVRTATEVTLYLDGVQEIVAPGTDAGTSGRLILGSYYTNTTNYRFSGKMDEVRLWDAARTEAEINAKKDVELTGAEADLLVYYNFNNGIGSGVIDNASSGGYKHGVLTNMQNTSWITDDEPLPVELISLTVINSGSAVILNWQTATEVNNYGFEVEKIVDGNIHASTSNWKTIGFVKGHGSSNSPKEYSFIDSDQLSGVMKYRLKQIDNNGSFEYSDIVTVERNQLSKTELYQNYPNPFNPTTVINYTLSLDGMTKLSIFNILGQEIEVLINKQMRAGSYSIPFDGSNLSSGVYVYKLQLNNQTQVRKMLLMK